MCLTPLKTKKFLWWIFPKVQRAEKDIVVYKILSRDGHAPFKPRFRYHYGYNYPIKPCVNPSKLISENPFCSICGGWLHAFTNEFTANTFCIDNMIWPENYEIHRMIIPKGAKYILGVENDICAKCLKWD